MGKGDRRPSLKMSEKEVQGNACSTPDKLRRGIEQAKPEPEKEMKSKPKEKNPDLMTSEKIRKRLNEVAAEEKEEEELRKKTFFSKFLIEDIERGDYKRVEELLQLDHYDPNVPDEDGKYALIEAARNYDGKMVRLLIENGANPKVKDSEGKTAKHYMR